MHRLTIVAVAAFAGGSRAVQHGPLGSRVQHERAEGSGKPAPLLKSILTLATLLCVQPRLAALKKRVEELPRIAAWLAKRPVASY